MVGHLLQAPQQIQLKRGRSGPVIHLYQCAGLVVAMTDLFIIIVIDTPH